MIVVSTKWLFFLSAMIDFIHIVHKRCSIPVLFRSMSSQSEQSRSKGKLPVVREEAVYDSVRPIVGIRDDELVFRVGISRDASVVVVAAVVVVAVAEFGCERARYRGDPTSRNQRQAQERNITQNILEICH